MPNNMSRREEIELAITDDMIATILRAKPGQFPLSDAGPISWSAWLAERIDANLAPQPDRLVADAVELADRLERWCANTGYDGGPNNPPMRAVAMLRALSPPSPDRLGEVEK